MIQRDLRGTPLYEEAERLFQAFREPGTGQISDATDIHSSPDGSRAVFAGALMDRLEGSPSTRICLIDLTGAHMRVLTFGPNTDRSPRFSPNSSTVAFLSDRHKSGDFQLYLLDPDTGATRSTPHVDGWIEYLHWSADGHRILLGVAGHGADVAGGQGAITSQSAGADTPSWMPWVQTADEACRWRSAWVYDLGRDTVKRVTPANTNIWEAVWCGNDALAAVTSPGPGEGLWYSARLHVFHSTNGNGKAPWKPQEIYKPHDQLGWPSASPAGKYLAIVEALCSDRWVVAGDLRLIQTASGHGQVIDTHGIDVTYTEWRSERMLLLAGHRGAETVIGYYDPETREFTETWSCRDVTTSGRYVTIAGLSQNADCALVGEGFRRAPEIAVIRNGEYRAVRSFDLSYAELATPITSAESLTWYSLDGQRIQGWLLRPAGPGPHPLIMDVHGGPVWQRRPMWLGRTGVHILMLLRRGYAIFYPNPRGSTGYGQEFSRHVLGDMGGADTYDCLTGLDYLVKLGIADPKRLGVTGVSYGGFMTSWLITQDTRFAAAVAVAPVTNQVTEHLLSNIPHFVELFLADKYTNPDGKYFQRSPVMHAHKARTPTLNICGALDRCTPPEEAAQFHNALLENGVRSALVTYPEEGHGIHKFPAAIDYAARIVGWFSTHC
jgi:dipeptidyl aminopeptidase/acylaminoacyl peptidase